MVHPLPPYRHTETSKMVTYNNVKERRDFLFRHLKVLQFYDFIVLFNLLVRCKYLPLYLEQTLLQLCRTEQT